MADIRLGCSGWDYDEWIGPFYETKKESKLSAYGRVFSTAEINSTFYRPPSQGMVLGWGRYTPENFTFAAKVPQTVTHDRLLKVESGADRELLDYCNLMRPLLDAGKLAVLLLQLPPRLSFHETRTRSFFESMPQEFQFAMEFRNKGWLCPEAFELLKEFNVAYTVVDEPLLPSDLHLTSSMAYIRWHGHGTDPWYNYRYSREELEPWIPRLKELAGSAQVVYGYFNNHFHGYAPENCLEVLEMLGVIEPEQKRTLRRIRDFRRGIVRAAHGKVRTTTLAEFVEGPMREEEVLALLTELSSKPRVGRAQEIARSGIEMVSEAEVIEARVSKYTVLIDVSTRVMRHDCEDWKKNLEQGLLCKHISAVLLKLPGEKSVRILQDFRNSRERWTLEA